MNQHSPTFEIERAVPAENAAAELLGTLKKDHAGTPALAPAHAKKFNFRKLLMAGRLVRLGLLDGRAVSGFDRRRLCQSGQHHDRAEGFWLPPRGAGR
jgi:hypothetical protein